MEQVIFTSFSLTALVKPETLESKSSAQDPLLYGTENKEKFLTMLGPYSS